MSEGKWTEGPWEYRSFTAARGIGWTVGQPATGPRHTLFRSIAVTQEPEETAANVFLISAAPDLYEALSLAADAIKDADEGDPQSETGWKRQELLDVWAFAYMALAKARGEQS